MAESHFDEWVAERYEVLIADLYDPAVLDPAVDFLAQVADGGPVLEFGIGAGRVALPLSQRGLRVCGIDESEPMVAQPTAPSTRAPHPFGTYDPASSI
jgi:SAM-dependent methyltransferase